MFLQPDLDLVLKYSKPSVGESEAHQKNVPKILSLKLSACLLYDFGAAKISQAQDSGSGESPDATHQIAPYDSVAGKYVRAHT